MTVMMQLWERLAGNNPQHIRGNIEQRRLRVLYQEAPNICKQITEFAERINFAQVGFGRVADQASLDQILVREAEAFIPTMMKVCSHGKVIDDRPIYWGRLFTQYFFNWFNRGSVPRVARTDLCAIHELTSRHYANVAAQTASINEPRVILTAFDPFLLNTNIQQCNPSASIALTLAEIYQNSIPIDVFIFPVRYRAFNKGIVEQMLKPRFEREPLFVLTMSMGRDNFEFERFVGRRRSSTALDNLDYSPVKDGCYPPCLSKCPEFLEFTLPTEIFVDVEGAWKTLDNRTVVTKARGKFEAQSLKELEGEVCIQGSGGGFLSNEIAYRTRLLQKQMNKSFPIGHLHVPKASKFSPNEMWKMVRQTSDILDRLLEYCRGQQKP
ncbi:MAG: hypothetical protein OXH31_01480 [Gammaproteobacteria bacterium]|nr:hypothetical protein [Gammaproteobacteria bacterium]